MPDTPEPQASDHQAPEHQAPDHQGRARAERITRDQVAHVAALARLTLGDDELDLFTDQLASILDHAEDVEALDLHDVPPTSHPYPLQNVMRPDEVGDCLDRDEVLGEAPSAEDGMFRVPPVLGEAP